MTERTINFLSPWEFGRCATMANPTLNALAYAEGAHAGQVRKYGGEPYINHPVRVAELLVEHGITDQDVLSAALLHDVVEDCGVTFADLVKTFGTTVASYVAALSDLEPGNRAARKAYAIDRLSRAPGVVQSIKLSDLIDNTADIVKFDPGWAKKYLREKRELLLVLTRGKPSLLKLANRAVRHAESILMAKGALK